MDIIPIVTPVIVSYMISTFCPLTPGFDEDSREESEIQEITRTTVFPLLSGVLGFSWFLARHKAILLQSQKLTKKGTRAVVGKLSKYFEGSHQYTLDFAFIVLIAMFNWWIYTYTCQKNYQKAFKILVGTVVCTILVIYITASYTASSLLLLTPFLVWLLLMVNTTKNDYSITQSHSTTPDVEKANAELENEDVEVKEQFQIW